MNNTRRTTRRRGNSKRAEQALITRRLKSLHLSSPKTWYKSPGQYKDLPELPNAPPYFIKQRIVDTTTTSAKTAILPADLSDSFSTLYTHLQVMRIDCWAPTSDNTLALLAYLPSVTGVDQANRTFYGTGTAGHRRPYVSICISPKDAPFYAVQSRNTLVTAYVLDGKAAELDADLIFDFHVVYTATNAQLSEAINYRVIQHDKSWEHA